MNRLAIETATEFCSVALQTGDDIRVREALAPRRHAELVVPWTRALLADAGIGFGQLDSLAVSTGPGGFTSLRIGLSLVQGFALAHDLPVHPVPTLDCLAHAADPELGEPALLTVVDARMGEVYWACYRVAKGVRKRVGRQQVTPPDALAAPAGGPWRVVGPGLGVYREAIARSLGNDFIAGDSDVWPDGRSLLALSGQVEAVPGWAVEPVYVRDRVTG